MNVWMTIPSTTSTVCGGLPDEDILPYALPLWVETLAAASRLSLPSLSASLQQSFSPATTTQTGAAEVMGGLKLKIFSLILAALLEQNCYLDDVFTRDRGGLRCGCDILQGVWQSIQGAVCSPWQLEARTKRFRLERRVLESRSGPKRVWRGYLPGSLWGSKTRLNYWSRSGGNKVSCQGIQGKVIRGLRGTKPSIK